MLISLNIKNFRSAKNEIELSLVAAKRKAAEKNFAFNTNYESLLATAVVYGPNASGKTTGIQAMSVMRELIQRSFKDQNALEELVTPFLFDEKTKDEPSEFDIIFIAGDIRYQYGFAATKKMIYSEWLYSFPKGRIQTLFTRDFNHKTNDYDYIFGRSYRGEKSSAKALTPKNSLFLSVASRTKNHEAVLPILQWFKQLNVIGINGVHDFYTARGISDNKLDKLEVTNFLKNADINIADFDVREVKFNPSELPASMPQSMKDDLAEKLKDTITFEIDIVHSIKTKKYSLPIEEESSGTRRMFGYAGAIIRVLKEGGVLFIDELNNHLHPLMVEYILKKFNSPVDNPKQAQIVFSTHDVTILNLLRRDQVWFCDRDEELSTNLTSLLEYKTRDGDNFERSYLSGRYGSIPILKI